MRGMNNRKRDIDSHHRVRDVSVLARHSLTASSFGISPGEIHSNLTSLNRLECTMTVPKGSRMPVFSLLFPCPNPACSDIDPDYEPAGELNGQYAFRCPSCGAIVNSPIGDIFRNDSNPDPGFQNF